MKKAEFFERYGKEAYKVILEQARVWQNAHPEEVKVRSQKQTRKGGKYYEKYLKYQQTGLRGARNKIRKAHVYLWKSYKDIIAPESQIHHEWIQKTAECRGVALVEAKPHQYGIIDAIQILEITLLTEGDVKNGKKNEDEN